MSEALYLDHETRSTVDLRKTGVDIYRRHRTTDVIVTCGAIGKGDVLAWRPGRPVPVPWAQHIMEGGRIVAHNAPFEIAIHNILVERYGWPEARLEQWDCTMSRARAAGLPGSLEGALQGMGASIAKDKAGHALMMRMCKPRRIEPDGRIVWWDDEERMQRLTAYCADDVRGERWLDFKLPSLSDAERQVWLADRRLNARGVPLDVEFLNDAQAAAAEARVILDGEMKRVTRGLVPKASNVGRLREWLLPRISKIDPLEDPPEDDEDDEEDALPELRRRDVQRLLLEVQPGTPEHEALSIRLEAGKSSTKKVDAMLRRLGPGRRVRDMLMYYGAGTGRWSAAGSGIQLQNLPRDGVKDWSRARRLLAGGAEAVELVEGPTLDVISRMLRGAIALPDHEDGTLVWADYSSVEARGVAWLAGQDDLVEAFRSGAKIYERMAGRIFDRPEASIGKDSFERWVGKGVVLGSGYQMGAPKFQATCAMQGRAVSMELAEDAITAYREAFPKIPELWYGMQETAITAIRRPGETFETAEGRIRMSVRNGWLIMRLPTGSMIRYRNPRLERDGRFDRMGVVYDGVDSKTKKYGPQRTYGGRLCLAEGTLVLTEAGWLPIEEITTERVWDGLAWVRHDGPVLNGVREVLSLDGVQMTPDHRVLTTEGWRDASSCAGLERFPVQLPDGCPLPGVGWQEIALAGPVRLRKRADHACDRTDEGASKVVRLSNGLIAQGSENHARHDEASGFLGLAVHGRQVLPAHASGLEELRGPGNFRVPGVEHVRRFLGGHGADLRTGAEPRQDRQRGWVFSGQLSLDGPADAGAKHSGERPHRHPLGSDDGRGSGGSIRNTPVDTLSAGPSRRRVYDLVNAGPRHRFVIAGRDGPLISHNCENAVQRICRDIVAHALPALEAAGYEPILLVHDEIITQTTRPDASHEEVVEIMCRTPPGLEGFPIAAEGKQGRRYSK